MKITEFQGEYRFLSNFWPCNITIVGVPYKSVEAAYQASKTTDLETRRGFSTVTPARAKAMGRGLAMRDGWGDITKVECMECCLRAKFLIPEMKYALIATGDAELIEGNNWNDQFWGVCRGSGRNVLGKLLMMLRDELILHEAYYQSQATPADEICEHLHVDPNGGDVINDQDKPRTFTCYDDIPF